MLGDVTKGELGVTFMPGKEDEFKNNLSKTITYAKALHCSMLHVMAGNINEPANDLHWSVYESNLKYAADELKKNDLIGLIEPINNHTVPKYFMNSYDKGNKKHYLFYHIIFIQNAHCTLHVEFIAPSL